MGFRFLRFRGRDKIKQDHAVSPSIDDSASVDASRTKALAQARFDRADAMMVGLAANDETGPLDAESTPLKVMSQ